MTIDTKILEDLKAKLILEREELEKNLGRIARPVNKAGGDYEASFEDIGSDKDDNATEVDMYSEKVSVEMTLEKKLQEIIGALERIEKGTYGVCENCKKDIAIERLQANPSAKTCTSCK